VSFGKNSPGKTYNVRVKDNAYHTPDRKIISANTPLRIKLDKTFGWYDLTITVEGNDAFRRRYAGHVETGKMSRTDPAMGGEQ